MARGQSEPVSQLAAKWRIATAKVVHRVSSTNRWRSIGSMVDWVQLLIANMLQVHTFLVEEVVVMRGEAKWENGYRWTHHGNH